MQCGFTMSKNKENRLGKKSIFSRFFAGNSYCWLALACTVGIMMLVYYCYDLFPFGDTTILRMDLYHQYGPLFAEFYDRVTNLKSFIYSWNTGLGSPFLGNYFNYLSSPSAIIILLLGHENMPESIAGMILVKAAFSAAAFTYYLKKSRGRHDYSTAAFGILYALCGYFVAYYWNVMWIDAMVYFPLVMYGLERIINKRKPSVYIAFLALTLLSNYYMGYMTCIFSVIYFIVYYFSNNDINSLADNTYYYLDSDGNKKHTFIQKIKGNLFLRSGFTFAFGSVAAGCLVAFSLIPVFLILKSCSATSGTWPSDYRSYFSIFDFLANHLASVDPTIRSSGEDVLPNVYCGIGTLILVPLYLFSKRISLKEKIASVFTLGLLFFSFNINYLNYIWHGFHFPNDLPYRFSFMYCFILLVMAYKAFENLSEYTGRQILGTGVAVVFAIVMIQEIGSKNVEDITVLLSVIFAVTYCLVFYILRDIEKQKTTLALLLLCCIIGEIACANTDRFSMTQTKTNYCSDYNDFKAIKNTLDELEDGDTSYRMELTWNRARMDPSWYGYNGISTFSSMAYEKMSNVQSDLGVYGNYINSYTYYLQTPVYNMMHSLKYVVDNDEDVKVENDYYTELKTQEKFTAYQNDYYLSIANTVSSDITDWYTGYSNPFDVQGDWFEYASGLSGVFSMMDISDITYYNIDEITSGLDTGDLYFNKTDSGTGELTVYVSVQEQKHCYLYVNSSAFESITIDINGESNVQSVDEAYIYDLGIISPDDEVSVLMSIEEDDYGYIDFYPYYVNDDVLNEGYEIIKENQLNVESFEETKITGTINAKEECVCYTSIPYDKGWTVTVDGKEISEDDYIAIADAYLGFKLAKGEHKIVLSYHQRGLLEGACISALTVFVLLVFALIVKKRRPLREEKYALACEKAENDFREMKEEETRAAALKEEAENAELAPEDETDESEAAEENENIEDVTDEMDLDEGDVYEMNAFDNLTEANSSAVDSSENEAENNEAEVSKDEVENAIEHFSEFANE